MMNLNKDEKRGKKLNKYWRICDAESAFSTMKRKIFMEQIASIVYPGISGKKINSQSIKSPWISEDPKLSVKAVKGIITRNGKTKPFAIPSGKLKILWTKLWLQEDIDNLPEIAVQKRCDGWYLEDDPLSVIIFLLLRSKKAEYVRIKKIKQSKSETFLTHDFQYKICKEKLSSAG